MAIGKDTFEKAPAKMPAPERDEDMQPQNPPAKPDLPPDSADKPTPPGTVDNG